MANVDDKIKQAIDLCNKEKLKFYQFDYLYPFTTENISGYIDMFDLKDKTLFTVGSSGDQVLNAILSGCKEITLYDICPFAKEYFYLKMAILMYMNRENYLKFLCYYNYPSWPFKNRHAFNDCKFEAIYEYLKYIDLESSYFWYELYTRFSGREIRKNLFNKDEYNQKVVSLMNRYLNSDEAFNALRDKIESVSIEFINDDIFNLSLTNKYDSIFLSNIAACFSIDKYKEVFDKAVSMLNDNGKVLVSYLYDTDAPMPLGENIRSIYNIKEAYKTLSENLEYNTFIGNNGLSVNDKRMTDGVLTYKKLKKI